MDSHGRWDDCDLAFMIMMIIKWGKFKCIKCVNKGDEFDDVPTCCTMTLINSKLVPFRAHVVVFPFLAQAHNRPVILLSKSLAIEYDVAVTFVNTTLELDITCHKFEGED